MVTKNKLSGKRILIIGAGQVGVFASRVISKYGAKVILADINPQEGYIHRFGKYSDTIKADATDPLQVTKLFSISKPHIVILSHGITTENIGKNKALARRVNVNSIEIIAAAAIKYKVKRIIYLSSFAVYKATSCQEPLTEDSPLSKQSLYSSQKLLAEKNLTQIAQDKAEVIILRPSGCYGPILFNRGSQSSVFIESLLVLAVNNRPIRLFNHGEEEFLYVKDLAKAISTCCHCNLIDPVSIFNIGSGKISTTEEIIKALRINFEHVSINTLKPDTIQKSPISKRSVLSFKKAKKIFHFSPRYDLSEGIKDYLSMVNFKIR